MVFLTIAGCQPTGILQTESAHHAVESAVESAQPREILTPAGLILLAEAELTSGNTDQAIYLYLQAAAKSANPEVSERAASVARQAGSDVQIEQALDRWRAVEPDSRGALEASIIFNAERNRLDALEDSLSRLLALEPDYRAHWLASFWARLEPDRQTSFLNALTRAGSRLNNGSLAMVVTEAKNRVAPQTGTDWLDAWIESHVPPANVVLFRSRLELPDRQRAIAFVERFTEVKSDLNVRAQLARWHGLEGSRETALSILRSVIEEDGNRHQDLLTLGLLEMQSGNLDIAEKHLKSLLASEQYRSNAYYHLGEVAIQNNQDDLAIDRFLRVDRSELVIEARKQLANLAMKQNTPDQALRWFSEARLLFPNFKHELYLAEAQFQTANRMADAAIPLLTEAFMREPDSVEILYTRALAYEQLDDITGAENDLRKILELKPNDPDALNALGYTLADRTDRHKEALSLIENALTQKPESAAILDSMGWVLFKLGRLDEAEPYFAKAWEMSQDHEIAAHYGELLWRLGQQQKAREIWGIGYESTPESDKIHGTIKRLTNS